MSNHVLFELNRWRRILLYWCALWQVMMPVAGWMIWQQNKTSNALPLLLVRIPKFFTNDIWAFVVLWNVYFRCSPSCVSWWPVATSLPCALAVNSPMYFGDLWSPVNPVFIHFAALNVSLVWFWQVLLKDSVLLIKPSTLPLNLAGKC